MSIITISPYNQKILIDSENTNNNLNIISINDNSSITLSGISNEIDTILVNNTSNSNNILIEEQSASNNINLNQNIYVVDMPQHQHPSSQISNFNSAVSGLFPSISGSNYISSIFNNNTYTISASGLQPSGNYANSIHSHISSNISDFNSAVSGLLPVKNIIAGTNINVSSSGQVFTISSPTQDDNISSITCGRLTIESNNPLLPTTTSSSTLYFTPYLGNQISLYDISSSKWKIYNFNQISLSLSGMISNTNYDIFIYNNNGSITLEKTAWASNLLRNTPISYLDGVLVQSYSFNKKYIGTVRSISTTSVEDSSTRRFIFNNYNQILKPLIASDNITHTYTSSTIRPYRNISTLGVTRAEFINGIAKNYIDLICKSRFSVETNISYVGIGIDTTTSFNTNSLNIIIPAFGQPAPTLDQLSSDSVYIDQGYHYIQMLQSGSSVSTFYNSSLKAMLLC